MLFEGIDVFLILSPWMMVFGLTKTWAENLSGLLLSMRLSLLNNLREAFKLYSWAAHRYHRASSQALSVFRLS